MRTQKTIGILLIIGAIGLLVPYTMLTIHFEYPDILRQDTATILTKFHQGGSSLIFTWFAFALTGIPLIPAYIFMGRTLDQSSPWIRVATQIGVIGLVVQLIGLLRWTFVVPVIADSFVSATDEGTKAAAIMAFKTIHQFAGVLLGEHLGQLFTIAWTIIISTVMFTSRKMPRWIGWLGLGSAFIYFMAQAELLHTVIPGFPVWDMAGFIGSTLWLVWLTIIGIRFINMKSPA
jgi:hypothetical protein